MPAGLQSYVMEEPLEGHVCDGDQVREEEKRETLIALWSHL